MIWRDNMQDMNRLCHEIFNFYYGDVDRMYAPELQESERKRLIEKKEKLDSYLLSRLEDDSFQKEIISFYWIQLYSIVYLKNKLKKEVFLSLVQNFLKCKTPDHNCLSPYVLVLMSENHLTEDIICTINKKIEEEIQVLPAYRLGNIPYDYRYHLLKREETPEDIQGKILSSYDEFSLEELQDIIQKVLDELNNDFVSYKIKDISQIDAIPDLKREYHYFQIMKKYYSDRIKKEKIV